VTDPVQTGLDAALDDTAAEVTQAWADGAAIV
jgi:hypothetical protein